MHDRASSEKGVVTVRLLLEVVVTCFLAGCDSSERLKTENTSDLCSDGVDNDADGHVDCEDQDCRGFSCADDGGTDSDVDVDSDGDTDTGTGTDSGSGTDTGTGSATGPAPCPEG